MVALTGPEHELQREWLEKHSTAAWIYYDSKSALPSYAVYVNPIYQSKVADVKNFFDSIGGSMRTGTTE